MNWIFFCRPCRCQLQIEVPKENLGYLIEAFVKHAIQKIKDVANGCVAVSKDIKIASELDNVFQALTKLFQVHFYMTDRGKKLQVRGSMWLHFTFLLKHAHKQNLYCVRFLFRQGLTCPWISFQTYPWFLLWRKFYDQMPSLMPILIAPSSASMDTMDKFWLPATGNFNWMAAPFVLDTRWSAMIKPS